MVIARLVRGVRERSARARERRELLQRRWEGLPEKTRVGTQWIGRSEVACGATHGVMEKCNYTCTSCYLTDLADWARPLPFDKVKQQLDTLRRELGHDGKVQITSGEVTLLKPEELGRIVAYARELGLDPMVMTNGQRFFDEPDYLPYLVREHGLRKVCCHIDVTQPERAGEGDTEKDLNRYRDQWAALVRATRRATGQTLHSAHTITVTPQNLEHVTDVVDWALENCDAVRMLSFQPLAEVGRTKDQRGATASFDAVWERVQRACGGPINRDAIRVGHEDCNATVPLLVLDDRRGRRKVVEVIRRDSKFDRHVIGKFIDFRIEAGGSVLRTLGEALWSGLSQPITCITGVAWAAWRGVPLIPFFVGSLVRGRLTRIKPIMVVVHRFMSPDELETERGKERLEACVFKLPMEDGSLISMCEMNATDVRERLTFGM